jgi:chromosome segregation ATPase
LLQLRDSLKIYRDMKAKYEILMAEVLQLEVEKSQLAQQLENATVDPTQGCSTAIKKELEKVEQSLARARNETRKHRQMYRKAEQEAQRCRVLERKVMDLKTGKVQLIKKQKEDAVRHREYTETKTREIMSLKRKERHAEQKVSMLQTEIIKHKNQLQKRHTYCGKLAEKLKQTESHLMKLLSMRHNNLVHDRTSSIGLSRRRTTILIPPRSRDDGVFASVSEETRSINFILDKAVAEKVNLEELKNRYEERVAEYGETMRKMVANVKSLKDARARADIDTSEDSQDAVRELEQTIEEIELKAELVGSQLENLSSQLSVAEADSNDKHGDVIRAKDAPVLRTLLMETIDKLAASEVRTDIFSQYLSTMDGLSHAIPFLACLSWNERPWPTRSNERSLLLKASKPKSIR